jgi:hypothetical protein
MPKLKDKLITDNESYQELVQAFGTVAGEYAAQVSIMTRQMAGVHYNRAFKGQGGETQPLTPVSLEKQKEAMTALSKYAFSPNAFDQWSGVYAYLLKQRRGFGHFSDNDDPNIHARVLSIQRGALSHLLHPNVLERFSDVALYGNKYSIDAYMKDLTQSIFAADLNGNVNTFRQNLQVEYTSKLIRAMEPKSPYDYVAQGIINQTLSDIDNMMKLGGGDALTKAHRNHLHMMIDQWRNN